MGIAIIASGVRFTINLGQVHFTEEVEVTNISIVSTLVESGGVVEYNLIPSNTTQRGVIFGLYSNQECTVPLDADIAEIDSEGKISVYQGGEAYLKITSSHNASVEVVKKINLAKVMEVNVRKSTSALLDTLNKNITLRYSSSITDASLAIASVEGYDGHKIYIKSFIKKTNRSVRAAFSKQAIDISQIGNPYSIGAENTILTTYNTTEETAVEVEGTLIIPEGAKALIVAIDLPVTDDYRPTIKIVE